MKFYSYTNYPKLDLLIDRSVDWWCLSSQKTPVSQALELFLASPYLLLTL